MSEPPLLLLPPVFFSFCLSFLSLSLSLTHSLTLSLSLYLSLSLSLFLSLFLSHFLPLHISDMCLSDISSKLLSSFLSLYVSLPPCDSHLLSLFVVLRLGQCLEPTLKTHTRQDLGSGDFKKMEGGGMDLQCDTPVLILSTWTSSMAQISISACNVCPASEFCAAHRQDKA